MSQPTALEYARHYNIAVDHRKHFQQQYDLVLKKVIQDVRETENVAQQGDTTYSILDDTTERRCIEPDDDPQLMTEQLERLKNCVTPPSIELQLCKTSSWQFLLPDHKRIRHLYIEKPLLYIGGGDVERDMQRVRKGVNLEAVVRDIYNDWQEEHRETSQEGGIGSDSRPRVVCRMPEEFKTNIAAEKLEVADSMIGNLLAILQDSDDGTPVEHLLQHPARHQPIADEPMEELELDDSDSFVTVQPTPTAPTYSSQEPKQLMCEDDLMNTQEMLELLDNTHTPAGPYTSEQLHSFVENTSVGTDDKCQDLAHDDIGYQTVELDSDCTARFNPGTVPNTSPASRPLSSNGIYSRQSYFSTEPSGSKIPMDTDYIEDIPNFSVTHESAIDQGLSMMQSFDACNRSVSAGQPFHPEREEIKRTQLDLSIPKDSLTKVELRSRARLRDIVPGRTMSGFLEDLNNRSIFRSATNFENSFAAIQKPFPRVDLKQFQTEQLETGKNGAMEVMLEQATPVRSSELLWKSPGIRILKSTDGDASEDESAFEAYNNIECFEDALENDVLASQSSEFSVASFMGRTLHEYSAERTPTTEVGVAETNICKKPSTTTLSRSRLVSQSALALEFSASKSLSSFLDLRGKKFSTSKPVSACDELCDDPIEPTQCSSTERKSASSVNFAGTGESKLSSSSDTKLELSLPKHEPLSWRRSLVINNDLVQSNPMLITFCEKSGGSLLKIVYRDFGSADVAPDIILGPDSCLIVANLQSFIQKSLPGQKKSLWQSLMHEKIARLCHRFGLVVLVVTWPMTALADTLTLTKLIAFCVSISQALLSEVKIRYAPYHTSAGPQATVNAWVWTSIVECAFPTQTLLQFSPEVESVSFIQDETVWELFLRAAGMNTMTAQLIPIMLKAQTVVTQNMDVSLGTASSLSQFVRMSLEERLSMFGNVVSSRTIRHVSSAIDR